MIFIKQKPFDTVWSKTWEWVLVIAKLFSVDTSVLLSEFVTLLTTSWILRASKLPSDQQPAQTKEERAPSGGDNDS